MTEKKCTKCKLTKPVSDFHKDRCRKDGYRYTCKLCVAEDQNARSVSIAKQRRGYYIANRERILADNKKRRSENVKRYIEHDRRYYYVNRKRILEKKKEYVALNTEQRRLYIESLPGGVYRLVCVQTGDVYFGSTTNLPHRRNKHFQNLRDKKHDNPILNKLCRLYGPDDFVFETIIHCDDHDEGLIYEQLLIDRFPCCNMKAAISK